MIRLRSSGFWARNSGSSSGPSSNADTSVVAAEAEVVADEDDEASQLFEVFEFFFFSRKVRLCCMFRSRFEWFSEVEECGERTS